MRETLEEAKAHVRKRFLGKHGIHAVGVSRSRQEIRVYLSPEAGPAEASLVDRLREAAAPFAVVVVELDSARLS